MLFPVGFPVEDWFDQTRRQKHLERVKESAQKVKSHQSFAQKLKSHQSAENVELQPSEMAYPHDRRTPHNDFT